MNFWIDSSNEDYDTMIYMKKGKKMHGVYSWVIWYMQKL